MSLKGIFPIDKWDFNSQSILTDLLSEDLEFLTKNSIEEKYAKSELVFREGAIPSGIYYIKSGKVKKYKVDNFGKEKIFYVANMGELIGYHAILASENYPDSAVALEESIISFILFVTFIASFVLHRKPVFALFSIIFGTWLFDSATSYLVSQNAYIDALKFIEYRTLLTGIAYILLGISFARGKLVQLSGVLYCFGSLGLLGAALVLGGWKPNQTAFWELLYPLLVFGTLYLSVYVKSKSFLTFGTIFLMVYILKITGEYFTEGLGWPLSLVVAGLLMIAVGYVSVTLNKKYIKTA